MTGSSFSFTKLFSSIMESTIWIEPYPTRIVWVAMLAMADRKGRVCASVPGLAKRAGVTRDECEAALVTFLSPDPDSRTKALEGRRIEPIDGGWCLVNYVKYREMRDNEERREYQREWDRTKRERPSTKSDKSDSFRPSPTQAEAEGEPEAESKNEFDRFWATWPNTDRKVARKECAAMWKRKRLDKMADRIIDHVNAVKYTKQWRNGYEPSPLTYLKQDRWEAGVASSDPTLGAT